MRKLKLESLQVESFATSIVSRERGTVDGNAKPRPIETYNVDNCGYSNYFDCTLGCSLNTGCAGACGLSQYNCLTASPCETA